MEAPLAMRASWYGDCALNSSHKSWGADVCTSSFQGDTGNLEQAGGRRQRRCLQASLVSGKVYS